MQGNESQRRQEARKALTSLYIAADEAVADDVNRKVEASWEEQGVVLDRTNPFSHARKIMIETFQRDPGLWLSYRDNIAMLLHDRHGITDMDKRNRAAAEIMKLLFDTVHDGD